MELATSFSNHLNLHAARPSLTTKHSSCKKHGLVTRKVAVVIKARKDDHVHHEGKIVDENMIVLRMRIKQMKMLESGNHDHNQPPSNWMEWEKKYYATHYNEDVFEAVGLLQRCLMNTRPSLALGMSAILALSLPISTFHLLLNFVELVKGFTGF
ncbi:hypothetical protein ACH5RR_013875 [Cinchona calisaya]|uniref:Mediator of RNA polymerase II transcription subunit n=1 Tax=Cinchona calisaya TaxID=153742 RepID=A0ABD3A2R7_9GENT